MTGRTDSTDNTPFADMLEQQGYARSAETRVFMQPDYAGIAYSDGDEAETRISAIIGAADDLTVLSRDLARHCTDWPSLYHLGPDRANLLRPFKERLTGADVLEIGAGCGALTRYLGECGARVLALEGSPRRAAIAHSRVRDLANVTVLAERFDRFKGEAWQGCFDVVTLIGVLEYAALFTPGEEPALAMLVQARNLLKPGGSLLLALENQLGLKYFAGAPEDHTDVPMLGIEDRYRADGPRTFGRKVLRELLNQAGFARQDWLFPFPDYKLPVSIVTEAGLACPDFDAAALAWQSVRRDPQLPRRLHFAPELAWPVLDANGLTADLANAFLIAACPTKQPSAGASSEADTLALHYSTGNRRAAFCKETRFVRREDGGIIVRYAPLGSSRTAEGELVRFRIPEEAEYVRGEALFARLLRCVMREGWSAADIAAIMRDYLEILRAECQRRGVAINIDAVDAPIPGECLDLTPRNILMAEDGSWHVIDQEWICKEKMPLGWLLFRSLLPLCDENSALAREQQHFHYRRDDFLADIFREIGMAVDTAILDRCTALESAMQLDVCNERVSPAEKTTCLYNLAEPLSIPSADPSFFEERILSVAGQARRHSLGAVSWPATDTALQTGPRTASCPALRKVQSLLARLDQGLWHQYQALKRGLATCPLFDAPFYLQQDATLKQYRPGLLAHYLFHGAAEGRNPNPYFFTSWYLAEYPDVAASGVNPLLHFILNGTAEGRNPNPYFLTSWYGQQHPALQEQGINPLVHFIQHGQKEGLRPNPHFDPAWYADTYLNGQADSEAFAHFLRQSPDAGYSPNADFDAGWYMQNYPWVKKIGMHPLQHYIEYGLQERTKPNSRFSFSR